MKTLRSRVKELEALVENQRSLTDLHFASVGKSIQELHESLKDLSMFKSRITDILIDINARNKFNAIFDHLNVDYVGEVSKPKLVKRVKK